MKISVTQDRGTCFRLRHQVFVEEQNVPLEEEQDAQDETAVHLLAEDGGSPIGTARLIVQGAEVKIGRVCIVPEARGNGSGAALINTALEYARDLPGISRARLGAQVTAIPFYARLGFHAVGSVYDDVGIPHRDMVCDL